MHAARSIANGGKSLPQKKSCEFINQPRTKVKNSLLGPPKSMAPSEVPTSSQNLTEILF